MKQFSSIFQFVREKNILSGVWHLFLFFSFQFFLERLKFGFLVKLFARFQLISFLRYKLRYVLRLKRPDSKKVKNPFQLNISEFVKKSFDVLSQFCSICAGARHFYTEMNYFVKICGFINFAWTGWWCGILNLSGWTKRNFGLCNKILLTFSAQFISQMQISVLVVQKIARFESLQ